MRVQACPNCASLGMKQATMSDGVVAGGGELMLMVCPDCNFRGAPVLLDDEQAYLELRRALRQAPDQVAEELGAFEADPPRTPTDEDERIMLDEARRADAEPPARPPRVTAALIMAIGAPLTLLSGLVCASQAVLLMAGMLNPLGALMGLLGLGIGLSLLRIGYQMWQRRPAGLPGTIGERISR